MTARTTLFTTIRTEGALLPPDLLQRIADGDSTLEGLTAESYHRNGEKLNEAVNQSWNTLRGVWANFKAARDRLPDNDLGTSITRDRWLLPLFRELDYGRLLTASSDFTIEGKTYPISHKSAEGLPIHLISYRMDLDKNPLSNNEATKRPHSLVQTLLNRDPALRWGFVSNGYKLRILRNNSRLTQQAYVEFDLQAMMDGEVYSDFALAWLLCHQSRVENKHDSWLETWVQIAQQQGTRVLDQLRNGVQKAIEALGVGFLDHAANTVLRDSLQSGVLTNQDYYRQLLRLVYRLLVMFTAEDRELLYDPESSQTARDNYTQYYSTSRLRRVAERLKGTGHIDAYETLRLVMRLLGGEQADAVMLGLPVLNSFLFRDEAVPDLIFAKIANRYLMKAVLELAFFIDPKIRSRRPVDFRNLGPEELGSVYESLLELHPVINITARTFVLATAGGNERKTTGSYYTPSSLVEALLDSALDPVIDEVCKQRDPVSALLALKICDPACGSGHFLVAAARRIARELARVKTGEDIPSSDEYRAALRDVISNCIYGVDINPNAVELCKVSLWIAAMEPGKPLSFLEGKIQVGNSLLGTTPSLMRNGIPDDAFNPIEGDDKKIASELKKKNREARKERKRGQLMLGETFMQAANYATLTRATARLNTMHNDTFEDLKHIEEAHTALMQDRERLKARALADAWCAAFVWEKVFQTMRDRL